MSFLKVTTRILVCAVAAVLLFSAMAFKYKDVKVGRHSFRLKTMVTMDADLRKELGKLDTKTFPDEAPCELDTVALDAYLKTLQMQAASEQWVTADFKIAIAGKKAAAGFTLEYTAKTSKGKKVKGGGTIVVDRPALYTFLQSER